MSNHRGRVRLDPARDAAMAALFLEGRTCAEIGAVYSLTPSAVSFVFRRMGVRRSPEDLSAIYARSNGLLPLFINPEIDLRAAHRRFLEQQRRAIERGVGWELSFSCWWDIWCRSGKWAARGRSAADSAVMAREGDVGPYSATNVRITTLSDNFVESWKTAPGRFDHRRRSGSESVSTNDASACADERVMPRHKTCGGMTRCSTN